MVQQTWRHIVRGFSTLSGQRTRLWHYLLFLLHSCKEIPLNGEICSTLCKREAERKVNQSGKRAKHVTQHTCPVTFATVPRVLPACCKPIKPHAFCGIDCQQVRRRFDVISGIFFFYRESPMTQNYARGKRKIDKKIRYNDCKVTWQDLVISKGKIPLIRIPWQSAIFEHVHFSRLDNFA